MKLAANAFQPWASPNEKKTILVGDVHGKPFVVRASSNSWLPLNVLIFASSKEDAKNRVHSALLEAMTMEYEPEFDRRKKILDLFENGVVEVEEYDPRVACAISWDSRGIL